MRRNPIRRDDELVGTPADRAAQLKKTIEAIQAAEGAISLICHMQGGKMNMPLWNAHFALVDALKALEAKP